jgi:tetratricopeptide (TPR) repeat protein
MRKTHSPLNTSCARRFHVQLATFALPLLGAAPALGAGHYEACEKTPTENEIAAAKGAFQAGSAAYNEADYDRAITYWEDAFRRDCTATALLLNLARAYESGGDFQGAIDALKTYNERNPDSPQLGQIEKRISRLEEQQLEQRALEQSEREAQEAAEVEEESEPTRVESPEVHDDSGGGPSVAPIIVTGVGGAVAVAGAIMYFKASSDLDEIEERCGGRTCPAALTREGNDARRSVDLWGGVTIAGLVIGAGGAVWWILDASSSNDTAQNTPVLLPLGDSARVDATVGPVFSGLQVSGEF